MRRVEGKRRHDGVAVEARRIARAGMAAALVLAAEIELHELDSVEISLPRPGNQVAQVMPIAGARHAEIDLAQQRRMGAGSRDEPAHRRAVLKPLRIQRRDPQVPRPREPRVGRHELDGVEGREPMQKPILVTLRQPRFIARLLQHGSVGTLDLRHDPVDDGTHAVRPSEKNFSILAN